MINAINSIDKHFLLEVESEFKVTEFSYLHEEKVSKYIVQILV